MCSVDRISKYVDLFTFHAATVFDLNCDLLFKSYSIYCDILDLNFCLLHNFLKGAGTTDKLLTEQFQAVLYDTSGVHDHYKIKAMGQPKS